MKINIPLEGKESKDFYIDIEYFDTHSLDYTLALIIYPALIQIKKDTKNTVLIWVRNKDLPKKLRTKNNLFLDYTNSVKEDRKLIYSQAKKRSHWCLNKMIKAFDLIIKVQHPTDKEKKQIQKGLNLFAKYYHSLWC